MDGYDARLLARSASGGIAGVDLHAEAFEGPRAEQTHHGIVVHEEERRKIQLCISHGARVLGSLSELIAGVVIRLDAVGMVHGHAVSLDSVPAFAAEWGTFTHPPSALFTFWKRQNHRPWSLYRVSTEFYVAARFALSI